MSAVREALGRGDPEAAADLAERALKSGREHPVLLCVMAMALQAAERLGDALPCLQRAAALRPTDASILNALARCLLGLDRPNEALPPLHAAEALEPRYAETHANIGHALHRLGRLAEADRSFLSALELQPDHISARVGRATLCGHYGAHQEARVHAEAVLQAAPDDEQAIVVLAMAELADGSPAAAEARLRRLMDAPRPDPLLASYLGDALHAQGRTEEAFQAWSRCGQELRRAQARRFDGAGVLADADGAAGVLERLPIGAWPETRPGRAARAGPQTHVFLLGFARSGTSLLGLALQGHDEVELLEEQEPMIDALRRFSGADGLRRLIAAGEPELDGLREAYWRRARRAGARLERRLFVDKQPMNSLNLPVIARLFPQAKILVARRDPRDVVLSCFRHRFGANRYTYELLSPEGAARLYAVAMRIEGRTAELASPQALAVRHEDLVRDFEGEMARVCGFLGLGWSEAMGDFAGRVRSDGVATPSASQLARGLNSDGLGQWRRYARQLSPVMPVLEPWVRRFGYAPGPGSPPSGGASPRPWTKP